ncbi:MAG TPA: pyridoxal phosphate-dependent aminotransferase [Candidatus Saccharimonadales bacterium]|nr:pyridoxal phosphate-dependent aminotransferase [Candidatus Saccharimonadales bacterium]
MKKLLTQRAKRLEPSPTFALDARVKQMQKEGIPVINLGIGEPDFETPAYIKKAGIQAIEEGYTHYTQTAGMLELRQALSNKFQVDNGLVYQPSQILVGSGSKPILYCAFQVLCEKGDEVIVPVPTWSSYVEQVKLTEATPVFIHLEPPFKLRADMIEQKISPKTKVILLNTPSNPTGAIIEKEELEKIAQLAIKNNIWVVTDEMYEKIIYGGKHISIASLGKQIYEQTITINGFSKTYAMTGWRLGYAGGPQEIITHMSHLQGQLTANASSISQRGGLAALTGPKKEIEKMMREFARRRELLIQELTQIPEFAVTPPEGSFFFFIGIKKLLGGKYSSSIAWCEALLQKKHVAVIPGEAFFAPGFFRLSFAAPFEKLEEGVKKIKEFIYE